jgi:hypothetical protein|tara:strand:+ start:553 stop:1182 length:630 start_codon:yes stop_codon:yes gene_type:complete
MGIKIITPLLSSLLALYFIGATPLNAEEESKKTVQVSVGSFEDQNLLDDYNQIDYNKVSLKLGTKLKQFKSKDNIEGFLGVSYSEVELARPTLVNNGHVTHGEKSSYDMFGLDVSFRYNFGRFSDSLIPFCELGVGILYNDIYENKDQGLVGQALEFSLVAGTGLTYFFNEDLSLDLNMALEHISNANLAERNGGINALGVFVGLKKEF